MRPLIDRGYTMTAPKDPFDNFDVFGSWDQEHWSAEAADAEADDDEDA
jgi:hypothetical protein